MKKLMTIFIAFITIFMTISSSAFGAINVDIGEKDVKSESAVERALADLNISIGDFFIRLVNKIVGEEVSIYKIVFNQIEAVNPNFFDKSVMDNSSVGSIVRDIVTEWYNFFMILAVAAYIVCLLVIGIRILTTEVSSAMAKGKELLTKWLVGVLILFCFPMIIKFVFSINEAIVGMIYSACGGTALGDAPINAGAEDWSKDALEFRSPQYMSRFTGITTLSNDEYTRVEQAKLDTYKTNLDMTSIMRAYAGITKKLIYVIIWMVLFWQTVVLLVKYYKRYFIIALLIVIFPLVCLYYIIDIAKGKNGQVFSTWVKELVVNIMIQSVHAIVYAIISSVVINRIIKDIAVKADAMNWILMIVAVNFLSEGEKITRKILGANASTMSGIGDTGKAMRGKINNATGTVKRMLPKGK